MSWFQRLLLLTILLTFALVVVGGTVRATDSGLGCPDWPKCHGEFIPPAEFHTLIEFSHRTVASVVGFVFLGVTFFTFRDERRSPLIFWLAASAGVVLVVQIILGGITVKRELPAEIVALHLGTAMTFMALLIVSGVISIARSRGFQAVRLASASPFTRLAILTAGATLVTLVLGSYISGSGASLACEGWPLCNGQVVPNEGGDVALHFLHRLVAGLLGVLLLGTTYLAFEGRVAPALRWALIGSCAMYVGQAIVGAANIWTELADAVVVAHLSLAALLWCVMVAVAALSYYLPDETHVGRGEITLERSKAAGWVR